MDRGNTYIFMLACLLLVPVLGCIFLYVRARKAQQDYTRAEKARQETVEALLHWNHALRTPLTTLSGITELLETSQQNMDEGQKKLIMTLKSATLSLKKITADMADSPLMNKDGSKNAG